MEQPVLIPPAPPGAAAVLGLRLAGARFALQVSDPDLAGAIAHLLRHHAEPLPPDTLPEVWINLIVGDFGEEKRPVCLAAPPDGSGRLWTWGVPEGAPRWLPERFYYRVLFHVLARALAHLGVARLHGALLFDPVTGPVLLLGERGAGKSTTAAAWLAAGGAAVVTDDTVLLRDHGGVVRGYGLHRELHIDPAEVPRLPQLPGLPGAGEYLPGSRRLAYAWGDDFPERLARSLPSPAHILWSTVDPGRATALQPLDAGRLEVLVRKALAEEPENAALPEDTARAFLGVLTTARGWEVTWGPDVWQIPGAHLGFLSRHLGGAE